MGPIYQPQLVSWSGISEPSTVPTQEGTGQVQALENCLLLELYHLQSGQIIMFHQPRFPWNKRIFLTKPPFGVRSCEVAIIWPASIIFNFWGIQEPLISLFQIIIYFRNLRSPEIMGQILVTGFFDILDSLLEWSSGLPKLVGKWHVPYVCVTHPTGKNNFYHLDSSRFSANFYCFKNTTLTPFLSTVKLQNLQLILIIHGST